MPANDLINRAHCKAFILAMVKEYRPGWDCRRVSKEVFDDLNFKIRHAIIGSVRRHPTIGVTFKELQ